MKKKTEKELYKDLKNNTLVIGASMILIFALSNFTSYAQIIYYKIVLLVGGLLLITYSQQKNLQEHPKFKNVLMLALSILIIIGAITLYLRIRPY